MPANFLRLRDKSSALRAQNQAALIQFLRTDIEVSLSLLETAQITRDPNHRSVLIETVRKSLVSIRHLAERIEDLSRRSEIQKGTAKLEESLREAWGGQHGASTADGTMIE
jgi:hypothetical protein